MPYIGKNPDKGNFSDLNGGKLILDADADTSITADTDDQIDIEIAGSDELKITSAMLAPASADGSALGGTSNEWSDLYLADGGVVYFGNDQDVTLTHSADTSLTCNLMVAATTFEPTGDTAAGDNAAIGYTAAEGLILTGQGSTNDVTIKNDADADVIKIATGATNVDIVGDVTAATLNADGDTAAGDNAAIGYTAAEGLILTGQGSTDDITIKNDADTTVLNVATGDTDIEVSAGNILFGTADKGVYLGVTTATAANLLDDYEEGTWTPALWTDSVQPTTSSASMNGRYTKIGRTVVITMTCSFTLSGTGTGTFGISGLPFSAASTHTATGVLTGRGLNESSTTVTVDPYIPNTNNKIYFNLYDQDAYPAGQSLLQASTLSTSVNGANMNVSIVYTA